MVSGHGGAKNGAPADQATPEADLKALGEVWPKLPADVRASILDAIQAGLRQPEKK